MFIGFDRVESDQSPEIRDNMASLDPYRDWLQVSQTHRPLTHYELLRLRPRESDSQVIRAAAARQVQRLSRVTADGQRAQVSQLLRQVAAARDCLLNGEQKAAYDASLPAVDARRAHSTSSADTLLGQLGQDSETVPTLPPRARSEPSPSPSSEATVVPSNASAVVEEPTVAVRVTSGASAYRRRAAVAKRKRSQSVLWLACGAMALAVPALAYVVWSLADLQRPQVARLPADDVDRPTTADNAEPPAADTATDQDSGEPVVEPDVPPPFVPPRHVTPANSTADPPRVTSDAVVEPTDTTDNAQEPSPSEIRQLRETLIAAQRAMAQRDLTAAERQLDQARAGADHPTLAARVSQSETLLHYVSGFWNAADQGVAGLAAGQEIVWREQRSIVVEADASRIVLRVAGVNRTLQSQQLPADLAALLAHRWLAADDPNSPVFIAAFHCVHPDGDRAQALTVLRTARRQGVEAADELLAPTRGDRRAVTCRCWPLGVMTEKMRGFFPAPRV